MTSQPNPVDVDDFLDRTVLDDDPALSAALEASDAAGLPKIAVSAQQGKFLSLLAGAVGARRILEIGTLGGFSTIWLARGAGPEGRVVTLEYEPKHADVARANLDRAGVGDRVEILVGAAWVRCRTSPAVRSTWCSSTPTRKTTPVIWSGP